MIIKEFFTKACELIVGAAKKVVSTICTAKVEHIAKAGLFVGTSAYVAYVLIKSLKNRFKKYRDRENMSIMDEALDLNFSDRTNWDSLHAMMDEVKEELGKTKLKKPSKRKKIRGSKSDFQAIQRAIEEINADMEELEEYGRYLENGGTETERLETRKMIEEFDQDMKVMEHLDRLRGVGKGDQYTLCRLWASPAY